MILSAVQQDLLLDVVQASIAAKYAWERQEAAERDRSPSQATPEEATKELSTLKEVVKEADEAGVPRFSVELVLMNELPDHLVDQVLE